MVFPLEAPFRSRLVAAQETRGAAPIVGTDEGRYAEAMYYLVDGREPSCQRLLRTNEKESSTMLCPSQVGTDYTTSCFSTKFSRQRKLGKT